MQLTNTVDLVFSNEDKITTIETENGKTWENKSGDMIQLMSKNIIKSGVHQMKIQSISDNGGFLVTGITEAEQTDY